MKTQVYSTLLLFLISVYSNATIVVHDPIQTAQSAAHEVINYIQWLDQQVNSLNSYVTQAESLARYGNPSSLVGNIPGVSSIARLAGTGMRLYQDYNQIQYTLNPNQYRNSMGMILSSYQQPNWTGMVSGLGVQTSPYQQNYQFQTSQWQVNQQVQTLLQGVDREYQQLEQQRDQAVAAMQGARTQSEVDKYNAVINAMNGALSELQARQRDLMNRAQMLNQQIGYGQQVYRTSQAEQAIGGFQKSMERGIFPNPSNNFTVNGSTFGSVDNPANGGNGDPGTSGNWYTGAWGADIGNPNTQGVALPESTLKAIYGDVNAGNGQPVTVTNVNTGQSITVPIVDKGPGASTGNGVDLTTKTAQQIGFSGSGPVKVTFPTGTLAAGTIF